MQVMADKADQLQVRSGSDVGFTLEAMRAAGDALLASLGPEETLFAARLLGVDARNGTMTVGWSAAKEGAQVLERPSISFSANHEGLHFQFVADRPRPTEFGNRQAIQLDLPKTMFAVQRRVLPRYKVPPAIPVKCEISVGPVSFESLVVDFGAGGFGAIVYDPSIQLKVGMTLPGVRIVVPGHTPVLAALEVRNIRTVTHEGGSIVKRAGCRFIVPDSETEALLRLFLAAANAAPA